MRKPYRSILAMMLLGVTPASAAVTNEIINEDVEYTSSQEIALNLYLGYGDPGFPESGRITVSGSGVVVSNRATFHMAVWDGDSAALLVKEGAEYIWGSGGSTLELFIGESGNASVRVESGGKLTNSLGAPAYIGDNGSGSGSVVITGTGSQWTVGGIRLGNNGNGSVTIDDAATLNVTSGDIEIARNAGSSGTLQIGTGGSGGWVTAASVKGGEGTASVIFDHSDDILFNSAFAGNLAITKRGAGTVAIIGSSDFSGSTTLEEGGILITASQSFQLNGDLQIATKADATLELGTAAHLTTTNASIGLASAATGKVNVSGEGTQWTTSNLLSIGAASGSAGEFEVESKAQVFAGDLKIADAEGATGSVHVSDAGTTLQVTNRVRIGGGGDLKVSAGATMTSGSAAIGTTSTGLGTATIEGNGSFWSSTRIEIGGNGGLQIRDQAQVSSTSAAIGISSGTATASIKGAESSWSSTNLTIGNGGVGHLEMTDSASLAVGSLSVGDTTEGELDLIGSTLSVGTLTIGNGSTGMVKLAEGASVTTSGETPTVVLGNATNSIGTLELVASSFGQAEGAAEMVVGRQGSGSVSILNGASLITAAATLGEGVGSQGQVTLTGNGSHWETSGFTAVVGAYGSGTLNINQEASFSTAEMILGEWTGGAGVVNVSGSGSLVSAESLIIGQYGTGSMTVSDAARVEADTLLIGYGNHGALTLSDGGVFGNEETTYAVGANLITGVINIGDYEGTTTAGTLKGASIDLKNSGRVNFNQTDSIEFSMLVSGEGSVDQRGSGVTTLSAENSYSGKTYVHSGMLRIDGDQSEAKGNIEVASGATLGGKGKVGGDVHLQNGARFDFNSEASFTISGAMYIGEGVQFLYQSGDQGVWMSDRIIFGANVVLSLSGAPLTEGSYLLFTYWNAYNAHLLSSWSVLGGEAGYLYEFQKEDHEFYLNVTAVPEPGTFALMAGSLGLVWLALRKRRPAV